MNIFPRSRRLFRLNALPTAQYSCVDCSAVCRACTRQDRSCTCYSRSVLIMSSNKKTCSRCGAENALHLRYCSMCGTTLAKPNGQSAPNHTQTAGEYPRPEKTSSEFANMRTAALQGAPMHSVGGHNPTQPSDDSTSAQASEDAAPLSSTTVSATNGPTLPPPGPDALQTSPAPQRSSTQVQPQVQAQGPGGAAAQEGLARESLPQAVPDSPHSPYRNDVATSSSSEQRCWRCGAGSNATAAFCQACGAPLRDGSLPGLATPVPPKAKLIVIAQDGSTGQEYTISAGQIDIGREAGDVRISSDGYACPRHARISWKNGTFWVSDLGSVNGVFVRITEPEKLHHGDIVLLGMGVVRFEIVTAQESALAPAIERGTRLFGSPATPRYARLVERTVEGVARNVLYLSKNVVTIGRETGDIVFTDDPFMSRQHAGLERQSDGSFVLKDLGSSNGTFLAIRGERMLPNGSHVRIGQHLFRLKVDA